LREPCVVLADKIKVTGNPVKRQNSRHLEEVSASKVESEKKHKLKERQSKVSGKDRENRTNLRQTYGSLSGSYDL
jgi:hypothetical protein